MNTRVFHFVTVPKENRSGSWLSQHLNALPNPAQTPVTIQSMCCLPNGDLVVLVDIWEWGKDEQKTSLFDGEPSTQQQYDNELQNLEHLKRELADEQKESGT